MALFDFRWHAELRNLIMESYFLRVSYYSTISAGASVSTRENRMEDFSSTAPETVQTTFMLVDIILERHQA
jgi:hypothetical protein